MFQENLQADVEDKPQLRLEQPLKKIRPHLPADLVGQRYVKRFWHPFGAIIALIPSAGEKPAWRTIYHYLQPSQQWQMHQDKSKLIGVRFGSTTNYATIDLDADGGYHNIESINLIKQALENIGIVDIVKIQSSFSGGYHLILCFPSPLPTFDLACVLELCLKNAGFDLRQGHLEIFPNAKAYGKEQITNYNAIRCPMQPGSGSLLLDDDLQPISADVSTFLDHCDLAASRQDLQLLKRAAKNARKRLTKQRYRQKETVNVQKWRQDWETIIATGWTGQGQTNMLLQIFVGYGIVFLNLEEEALVRYAVETATNAPGYKQYCRHQHQIEARVRQWVECTIRHRWYTPYASYPERLLGTFVNTYAEAIAPSKDIKLEKDNVIPFDRRVSINLERSQKAQRRIRWIVSGLEWENRLPAGISERAKLISSEYKSRFYKSLSQETLRKYLHLWHPQWYIQDPWLEKSQNPLQESKDGQFEQKFNPIKNQNVQNPHQMDKYGHSLYMKVCVLPPAEPSPLRACSADITELTVEDECVQSSVQEPISNFPSSQLIRHNLTSDFNGLLDYLNVFPSNINNFHSNSDKFLKLSSSGSATEKKYNQNLSINFSSIQSVAPMFTTVPPEKFLNTEIGEQTISNDDLAATPTLEELRKLTKLRVQAVSYAKRLVKEYCLIARRLIGGKDRERLEQSAKMQFYLDSGYSTLVTEAKIWEDANPGCLPFSLELAFRERDGGC